MKTFYDILNEKDREDMQPSK